MTFNPFTLENKTILVVGASSGIGREIALECAMMGATMIVAARREEKLRELVAEMPGDGHKVIPCDITKQDDIDRLVAEIGTIDGLLIASGIVDTIPVQFSTREKFDDLYNVNFFPYAEITRLIYKKKKIAKGGSIVFISSTSAFTATPGNAIYSTTKAALNALMRCCAKEFANRLIRVNTINPAMVATSLTTNLTKLSEEDIAKYSEQYPLKRFGEPKDIAPMAIYLLSDASSWVTGQAFILDGGRLLS